jgi:hypothetical protein
MSTRGSPGSTKKHWPPKPQPSVVLICLLANEAERNALQKISLLRCGAGAVGAGSAPNGAAYGARFGEVRVPSRGYVGRGTVPVAEERCVGVGSRLVGRRRAGRRRAGHRGAGRRRAGRGRRVGQLWPPLPVAGDGAPRYEVRDEVVAFLYFLERVAEINILEPNRPWVRHPTGE